uniref:hypothetical protein n=1 Tax=Microzonia abyssicola TaxID=217214 RepID=UPI002E75A231|nr:hypothetical protein V2497_pgp006 [Syringoderma abyssicola]WAM65083.1 hypothetical protein [Syringoderma abyssicola]
MKLKFFSSCIYLNGQKYKIFTNKPFSILDIIKFYNYQNQIIIIEHNKQIYNNLNKNSIQINNLDNLEIITIVGGG